MNEMVTLIEFLAPIRSNKRRDIVLAVLYYHKHSLKTTQLTANQIKDALSGVRMQKIANGNISDTLSKSGHYVDIKSNQSKGYWALTVSGDQYVQKLLNISSETPEVKNNVDTLSKLLLKILDSETRDFAQEAIYCLKAGLPRAAVVFLWSGAVLSLRKKAAVKGFKKVNSSIGKYDSKAHSVTKIDDFCYIKDSTLLLALQDLGIFDKGQRETLEESLKLRNRCGHPTKYRPGIAKVSSFIEDIIGLAF